MTTKIHGALWDGSKPGEVGEAATNGAVEIDGVLVGELDPSGNCTVSLAPGQHGISIIQFSAASVMGGDVDAIAGETRSETLILDPGKEPSLDAAVTALEPIGNVFPSTAQSLTLSLRRFGFPLLLKRAFFTVEDDQQPSLAHPVRPDGSIQFSKEELDQILAGHHPEKGFEIVLDGFEEDSFPYGTAIELYYGSYPVEVVLAAPPSNPALLLEGLSVQIQSLEASQLGRRDKADFKTRFISDRLGAVAIPPLPHGVFHVDVQTQVKGQYYIGSADFSADTARKVEVRLLSVADQVAGVKPYIIESRPSAAAAR